jgi:hypothetical protein
VPGSFAALAEAEEAEEEAAESGVAAPLLDDAAPPSSPTLEGFLLRFFWGAWPRGAGAAGVEERRGEGARA